LDVAIEAEPITTGGRRSALRTRLLRGLASCATEADIVQTLYAELHPEFGYDVILLQVLEREGWFHETPMDRGVLQDVRRRRLADSVFAAHYEQPRTVADRSPAVAPARTRGPGAKKTPHGYIWVPILHRGQLVGSVSYQLYTRRPIPPEETSLLERVHEQLGVLVSNAYLNEMTRNQAISLSALNAIARALSSTHDEDGVVSVLRRTLNALIPVDRVELVVPGEKEERRVRMIKIERSSKPVRSEVGLSLLSRDARAALSTGQPQLRAGTGSDGESAVWIPLVEGDRVRAALSVQSQLPNAYEQSTVNFLEQVGDQVSLALRNAWSYEAVEAQRRRLEVVNAVGRRLASSLDRWSITRTLCDELSQHLEFDIFSLASIQETPAGPVAEGYIYDSGEERPLVAVPLAEAGPSREAYESGKSILLQRSPPRAGPRGDRGRRDDGHQARPAAARRLAVDRLGARPPW
jgi:GAF domain-containing protein